MDHGSEARDLVRGHRRQAGLTQQQFADAAGVSVGMVRDLEQGRTARLRPESARQLAGALRLDGLQAVELTRRPDDEPGHGGTAGSRGREPGVRVTVLGPLAAWHGGRAVPLGPAKQKAVLGLLALHPGNRLQRAAIIDALWGDDPPATVIAMIHTYVSRLRRLLGPDRQAGGPGLRIVCEGTGYRLLATAGELDLAAFTALTRRGRDAAAAGKHAAACQAYADALELWRGEPVADVDALQHSPVVTRLVQERADAVVTYAEIAAAVGWFDRALPELRALADREPLNERAHAQLMIALAGGGQQAAALGVYDRLRRRLDDQLGVLPGPVLAQAYARVLREEIPAAAPLTAPASMVGPPVPHVLGPGLSSGHPGVPRHQVPSASATADDRGGVSAPAAGSGSARRPAKRDRAVPRQLPPAVPGFVGRDAELAMLTGMLDQAANPGGTVVISAIGGTAGVGKTALAVHWAQRVADRFPDGQLHVNLRGFGPSGPPVTDAEAVRLFLDSLGVPPERIPASAEAQVALYRSLMSGKRMLVLLDNAHDAAQVRPLLPGGPGCLVLVTSRSQLTSLIVAEGAYPVILDVLSPAEASELLERRLGQERIAAGHDAALELTRLCARLPLALAIVAARAAARPGFPLAALAAELADSAGRLDALDAGDPGSSVRAVFSWSARQLTSEAARMFRLLGIQPGPDISVPAAASLAGLVQPQARRLLCELARAHLIAEHVPGRYAFHDLLRAYAAEQAHHTDSHTDRCEATGRMLDHYLHTAAGAARLLVPSREPVALAPPGPGAAAEQPADHRQAMAWFEAEHRVLLAAVTLAAGSGFDSHAWQLPWAMAPFLQARGHWQEWAAAQRTALAAATRLGDAAAQALSGRLLAMACTNLGDHDQARGHYASSLTLYQRLGNRLGEAKIQHSLGVLAEHQGRCADALGHAEQALRLYQASGDKASEAEALNGVGWCHGLLGDYQQARAFCHQALTLSAEVGDRWTEGNAWDSLGYAEHHLGNLAEAADCYQRALSLHREAGDRDTEAEALAHLGDTRHAAGELAQAREAWQQALAILEDLQHSDAGQVRAKLASTNDHASHNPSAE